MRWWDRRLRKVAQGYTTQRVRVAVGVKPGGHWVAAGGSDLTPEQAHDLTAWGGPTLVQWFEVEVLVPQRAVLPPNKPLRAQPVEPAARPESEPQQLPQGQAPEGSSPESASEWEPDWQPRVPSRDPGSQP